MPEEFKHDRRRFLAAAAVPFDVSGCAARRTTRAETQLSVEGEMPSLEGAALWLNSQPLMADSLRGKVVLVQFCIYTCINWLRTTFIRPRVGREVPAARGASARFRVTLDGQSAVAAHGSDVDEQGNGTVTEQRL